MTDAEGKGDTDDFNWHMNPLVADASTQQVVSCFEDRGTIDMHAKNNGPDPAPRMSTQQTYTGMTYLGEREDPRIFNGDTQLGGGEGTGPGGYSNENVMMPPGAELGAWPNVAINGANPSATATVTTQYSYDPDLSNNSTDTEVGTTCDAKAVSEGPFCPGDSMLFSITVGRNNATTVSITDELDPCIDPSTVSGFAAKNSRFWQ